mmetsp:Transcript_19402/g.58634  ORF Transcript_19402/g.58634 Transcript_19402/m.58634 type:complete len:214 (+) Transcript_19402:381-1022(+)
MFYGPKVWDPVLIISQIVALQCLWYLSLCCLLWLLLGPYVPRLSMHHVLDWRWVSFHSFVGWMVILANVGNAIAASVFLVLVVERAKKCLDFAATLYILHLVVCVLYGGFSHTFAWWIVNVVGLVITAIMGEWLCLQREMRDIEIGSGGGRRRTTEMVSVRSSSMVAVTPRAVTASSFQPPFGASAPGSGGSTMRTASVGSGSGGKQMPTGVV